MADGIYVYYRVDAVQRQAALTAAHFVLDQMEARCNVRGRLMHRAEDPATWMEVFEGIEDAPAFLLLLDKVARQSGLLDVLAANEKRHIEHFTELS